MCTLCLQLRKLPTSSGCWALCVLGPWPEKQSETNYLFFMLYTLGWVTELVLPVSCLIVLRTGESADYLHMLRESAPGLNAVCIALDSMYLLSPATLLHTWYCVVSIMAGNFPVTTRLKLAFWQSSWRLYAFCWASATTSLQNYPAECLSSVILMFNLFCPTYVTYKNCSFVGR